MSLILDACRAVMSHLTTYILNADYKKFVYCTGWITQGVNSYLMYRQLKAFRKAIAASPEPHATRSPLAIKYQADRFSLVSDFTRLAFLTLGIHYNLHRRLWDLATTFPRVLHIGKDPTVGQAAHSILTLTLFNFYEQIIDFPLMVYSLCFIEHELPKGKVASVVGKLAVASAKACMRGSVVWAFYVGAILFAGRWIGDRRLVGVLAIWYFSRPFIFSLAYLFPSIIGQVYKEKGSIPEGELRDYVKVLADQVGYPLTKLFVVDDGGPDGKAVHKQNASCYGMFGFKYIAVTEALINNATPEEAAATIAHELGHWSLSHSTKTFLLREPKAFIFSAFYLFMDNPRLFERFGFSDDAFTRRSNGTVAYPIVVAFLLYQMIGISVQPLYRMIKNGISQYNEYQADRFAAELGYGEAQCTALRKLGDQDALADYDDWLFLLVNYSHPKVSDRIAATRRYLLASGKDEGRKGEERKDL